MHEIHVYTTCGIQCLFLLYIFIVKFAKDYNLLHVKCLSSLEYIYTIFLAFLFKMILK